MAWKDGSVGSLEFRVCGILCGHRPQQSGFKAEARRNQRTKNGTADLQQDVKARVNLGFCDLGKKQSQTAPLNPKPHTCLTLATAVCSFHKVRGFRGYMLEIRSGMRSRALLSKTLSA